MILIASRRLGAGFLQGAGMRLVPEELLVRLPPVLTREGPWSIAAWQWIALALLFAMSWVVGVLLMRVTRAVLSSIARRTRFTWDELVVGRIRGPLILAWALVAFYSGSAHLALPPTAFEFIRRGLSGGVLFVVFWTLSRSVDILASALLGSPWARAHTAAKSLVPLGAGVAKVGVLAIAVVALLSEFGYPVASLLAGLGIGGIAVALAAQKTVENLFGAFALGADEPFRVGDFVKIDETVGTVERIGLRSTRVRTLDRTLVTMPNGKVADARLESFSARDRIRLATVVGLVYATTASQMTSVLAGLERVLRAHPKIWPDTVVVRFQGLGASSLDVEVMAWFQTQDFAEFQAIRQEVLLDFLKVVEDAGTSFAFPTRTVHLAGSVTASQQPANRSPTTLDFSG